MAGGSRTAALGRPARSAIGILLALLAACAALAGGPARAQERSPAPTPVDPDRVIAPEPEGDTDGGPDGGAAPASPGGSEAGPGTGEPAEDGAPVSTIAEEGYGSAEELPAAARRQEIARVEEACASNPPPVSEMLGISGTVGGERGGSWGWVVFSVAAGVLVVAAGAFVLRRRRGRREGGPSAPASPLETIAAVVGTVGAVAGLLVQFVPGVGAQQEPLAEAEMEVRQVHARITRGEYARKTGARVRLSPEERREIGNVAWLEFRLQGYAEKRPVLEYGLYDVDAGGALMRETVKRVPVQPDDIDVQTLFVPIWLGYPKSRRFKAQFRLLDGERVQQMASTGDMRGSQFRYSCN